MSDEGRQGKGPIGRQAPGLIWSWNLRKLQHVVGLGVEGDLATVCHASVMRLSCVCGSMDETSGNLQYPCVVRNFITPRGLEIWLLIAALWEDLAS